MPPIRDVEKWRMEIQLAEEFRDKEFGEFTQNKRSKAGENIDYFDRGFSNILYTSQSNDEIITTLNLIHSITKNIVPSLYFKNPKVLALPKKAESEAVAPITTNTLNHYYRRIDAEEINQRVVWDAYVLGHGYSKVGYCTKFGMDIKDDTPRKKKSVIDKGLEFLGIKKPEVKEDEAIEVNNRIISEDPYISYVSPFDFIRDPRALTLEESMWVGQRFKRTVKQMKSTRKYRNTDKLEGSEPDIPQTAFAKMSQSEIDDFKTIDLYEIHYRTDDGIYLLVISKDGEEYREHYHEKSIYKMKGWQYDELTFNKHGHKPFAKSDITKIRSLQDRFTSTMDAILEQVDKFVPKLAANENDLTIVGKNNLENGEIGSVVYTNKDPNAVFKELNLTQFKGDLKVLADEIINIVTIQTGLTRAQLLGVASGDTATGESIAQGGQNLRLSDMNNAVNRFARRQAEKLWDVIKQFVELEELQMINGQLGVDEKTGFPKYNWISIDENTSLAMTEGEYDFDIEVGSTQKPDLMVIRKQFENLFSILARTDVIALMQQQGDKIVLSELLRMYLNLFPEAVKDVGKIIQKITQNTTGLVDPMMLNGKGGDTQGSNFNALEKQQGMPIPNMPSQISMSR